MTRTLLILLALYVGISNCLQCYDCYGTGPDHKECTQQRSCNGVACMIFDAGDNQTASAFCLLAMKGQKLDEAKDGCWLEPDGKGKHCMCFNDFCNKLVDRRNTDEADPMAPLLPTAEFLKQNPLVDYDAPNLGDYVDDGSHPPPSHVLFPSADKPDPRVAGGLDDDDDLVAVNLDDYDQQETEKEKHRYHHHHHHSTTTPSKPEESTKTKTEEEEGEEEDDGVPLPVDDVDEDRTKMARVPEDRKSQNEISASFKPPAWVVFLFPMAASWARFVTSF